MSLDNIVSFFFNIADFFDDNKRFEFHLNRKFIEYKNSSVLKVIFMARCDKEGFFDKALINRLHKKGHSCLVYFLPKSLLSQDINQTIGFFNFVTDLVKSDISKFKSKYNFERIDIISSSLGAIISCLVANNNDEVQNLFFIVPGSCLASSLWYSKRTKKLRKSYECQNIGLEQLKNAWSKLAPKNNIDLMSNKNIFIAISKSDKVIPYQFGKELADLAKRMYPQSIFVRENNHLGHYFTAVKYYLFDKEILK